MSIIFLLYVNISDKTRNKEKKVITRMESTKEELIPFQVKHFCQHCFLHPSETGLLGSEFSPFKVNLQKGHNVQEKSSY